jgi:hypothetical protein
MLSSVLHSERAAQVNIEITGSTTVARNGGQSVGLVAAAFFS